MARISLKSIVDRLHEIKPNAGELKGINSYMDSILQERESDSEFKKWEDNLSEAERKGFIQSLTARPFFATWNREQPSHPIENEYFLFDDFENGTKYVRRLSYIVHGQKRYDAGQQRWECVRDRRKYVVMEGNRSVAFEIAKNGGPMNYRLLIDTILERVNENKENKRRLKMALEKRLLKKKKAKKM